MLFLKGKKKYKKGLLFIKFKFLIPNFRSSTWNPRLNQQHQQPQQLALVHPKGHESDCNFTPSPVEPHPRSLYGDRTASKMFNTLPSDQGSPVSGSIKNNPVSGMFSSRFSHNLDDR